MANAKDRLYDAKPYVQRALQDEEVRENVKSAIAAAREIYDELIGARRPSAVAARVATDKEIQETVRDVIDDLKEAAIRVQGKQRGHSTRNAMLLFTGIVLGILFNPITGPPTRKWVSDRVLGESEPETTSGNGSPPVT
ncbi:MAG TPA: hypothetical protein VKO41_06175 [Gaiellaceae bacterium]|nr:hypothetical protein [Gaiellaceae bacterium]